MEEEISILQSIQLGFSRSLGSATSNEANKSATLRAEVVNNRAPSGAPFGPNELLLQAERNFFRYKPSKQLI